MISTSAVMNVAMVGVGNFGAARRDLMRKTGLFRIVRAYDISAPTKGRSTPWWRRRKKARSWSGWVMRTTRAYHITPYRHTFSIFGTAGALHKRDRYGSEGTTLTFQPRKRGPYEEETPVPIVEDDDADTGNLRSFHAAVRTGSSCYPALLDGARAVGVVFAAEESAKSHQEVVLPPVPASR